MPLYHFLRQNEINIAFSVLSKYWSVSTGPAVADFILSEVVIFSSPYSVINAHFNFPWLDVHMPSQSIFGMA